MTLPSYNLPLPNPDALPSYLHVRTETVFDEGLRVPGEIITSFSLLSQIDHGSLPNNTCVVRPQNLSHRSPADAPRLAIMALTAAGLDKNQVLEAYDTGSGGDHISTLKALYQHMRLDNLSNDNPDSWPTALRLIHYAYQQKMLRVEHPLHIRTLNITDRKAITRSAETILGNYQAPLSDSTRVAMLDLSNRYQVYPLATFALAKTALWAAPAGRMSESTSKPNHISQLITSIQRNGVPKEAKAYDAQFVFDSRDLLDGIREDTLAMASFGLSASHMSIASPKYRQLQVTPRQMLKEAVQGKLGYEKMPSDTGIVTMLVRDGHLKVFPNYHMERPLFPDTPLYNAILALIPSGMNERAMLDAITTSVPELASVDLADIRRAKAVLFYAADVSSHREFNTYLFARGVIDQRDIADVDFIELSNNVPRLRRKLGMTYVKDFLD